MRQELLKTILKNIIKLNLHVMIKKIVKKFEVYYLTVSWYLKTLGKVKKLNKSGFRTNLPRVKRDLLIKDQFFFNLLYSGICNNQGILNKIMICDENGSFMTIVLHSSWMQIKLQNICQNRIFNHVRIWR